MFALNFQLAIAVGNWIAIDNWKANWMQLMHFIVVILFVVVVVITFGWLFIEHFGKNNRWHVPKANRESTTQSTEHRTQNRASISIVDADLSTELKTIIKPMTRA